MSAAIVRYIVDEVAAAVAFCSVHLGFAVEIDAAGNVVELFQPAA